MMNTVKTAKFLMNLLPNTPKYQEVPFVSEIFRHPNYLSLSEEGKEMFWERLVHFNYIEGRRKPFDLFFPRVPLKGLLGGKRVLDLGCSVGGKTIFMAEHWGVREMVGIDVNPHSIQAANHYVHKHHNGQCRFMQGYAERMPFENDEFDAIVSEDTLEHVRSVEEALAECRRVLKPGGIAYLVFPSYHFPFGGAHISSATRTPFLEWIFSPGTLDQAYREIAQTWGEDAAWYLPAEDTRENWSVVKGGIGVNGIKYGKFMRIAGQCGFRRLDFVRIPLLYASNTAVKHPFVKILSSFLIPLLHVECFRDHLSHRLVFALEK